jgi:hypothetical protein
MPSFEKCAKCGELLKEQYGATQKNRCVNCMAADLRAADEVPGRAREATIASARVGSVRHNAERREQLRCQIMTSRLRIGGARP